MIFYFSGTGNSKRIAEALKSATGNEVINIADCVNNNIYKFDVGETLIFVFPIYAWSAPKIVSEFAKKLVCIKPPKKTVAVCTCGEDGGNGLNKFCKLLYGLGYGKADGCSIVMPNNFILGMDSDSETEIEKKLNEADLKIAEIAADIAQDKRFNDKTSSIKGKLLSGAGNWAFNKFMVSVKPFYAGEKCVKCGKCVENCPLKNIKITDKVEWGNNCAFCLSCLNRCPEQAIEHGKSSEGRKRYYYEKYEMTD